MSVDIYLVLDLSVTITQNVDVGCSDKVHRALSFAETFIEKVEKSEVNVHLSRITSGGLVRTLFQKFLARTDIEYGLTDFWALKKVISDHRASRPVELLVLSDMVDEFEFPRDYRLSAFWRFILLSSFEGDGISEKLIAALECFSLEMAVFYGLGRSPAELDTLKYFPTFLFEDDCVAEVAKQYALEERTKRIVDIVISPSLTVKAKVTPGIPKHLVIFYSEMTSTIFNPVQVPTFKLAGFVMSSSLTRVPQTPLIHSVMPVVNEKRDALNCLVKAMTRVDNYTGILIHSSGEECFLRAVKHSPTDGYALVIQFYPRQFVQYKPFGTPGNIEISKLPSLSYKATDRFYWSEASEIQQDANKLCRRLKRDPTPKAFYEDLRHMSEFAIACDFQDLGANFACLLEKRAASQDLHTNYNIVSTVQILKKVGFEGLLIAIPQLEQGPK
ncbi:unnamed protein product [Bursaphelenchus xylophilus]|uniref:(pine wood nematode) hypothetical protein n=1 Tax=Bursaphelenchus xylophilus TaxID=6326 RepID=A0A1I7RRE9_BURXY|nr:unnamed protein product [Bursaphelenchus xylophilus]CAG9130988.1 unnamed protein product [Bursaphelenchus xylophilus]